MKSMKLSLRLVFSAVLQEIEGTEKLFVLIQDHHFALLPRLVKTARPGAQRQSSGIFPGPTRKPISGVLRDSRSSNSLEACYEYRNLS